MRVIGIDLSGPSNTKDTVLTVFEKRDRQLKFIKIIIGANDSVILDEVLEQSKWDEVTIGIDAPLSYQDGGGDRPGDKHIRQFIVSRGMKPGSIMPPTFNRMVYLTLRGIKISREIQNLKSVHPISMVEVHPGAVMGSRIAPEQLEHVLNYKQEEKLSSRLYLRNWFLEQGLVGIPSIVQEASHTVDACAAALGAWHWRDPSYEPRWLLPAIPPHHPYDYCC